MATTTNDATKQATQAWEMAGELYWDAWNQGLGFYGWAGEQGEKLFSTWVEQGKLTRDEGLRLQREWTEQARANQREFQAMVSQTVKDSTEAFRSAFQQQLDDLRSRVEHLNDELRAYRENAASK